MKTIALVLALILCAWLVSGWAPSRSAPETSHFEGQVLSWSYEDQKYTALGDIVLEVFRVRSDGSWKPTLKKEASTGQYELDMQSGGPVVVSVLHDPKNDPTSTVHFVPRLELLAAPPSMNQVYHPALVSVDEVLAMREGEHSFVVDDDLIERWMEFAPEDSVTRRQLREVLARLRR